MRFFFSGYMSEYELLVPSSLFPILINCSYVVNVDAYYIWQKQTVFSDEANMLEFVFVFKVRNSEKE